MKIGELAKLTDCQVETIRYYEREGLLPEPARSEGNYRLYTQAHVERLTFIRNCRSLDMTLKKSAACSTCATAPRPMRKRECVDRRAYPPRQGSGRQPAGLAGATARPAPALWRRTERRALRDFAATGSQRLGQRAGRRTQPCGQKPRALIAGRRWVPLPFNRAGRGAPKTLFCRGFSFYRM